MRLMQVGPLDALERFLQLGARRSCTVTNKAGIGHVLQVNSKTAKHWLLLLQWS